MNKNLILIFLLLLFVNLTACKNNTDTGNKMNDTTKVYTNNLINEKSPYLLQHAHNPINWFPWREEAFEKAQRENKPIFLSIGYSTCHWCHVMEHESFEDEEVADLMNDTFISIKVDREERPDIDNIYMSVCQMLTGSGGWPLTIVMTPDQKPFFAGTYYPKHTRGNRIGMMELIPKLKSAWENQRDEIYKSAEEITNNISTKIPMNPEETLTKDVLDNAFKSFSDRFDPEFGGFGERPKFPSPHNLSFLLRYYSKTNNENSLQMVEKTLTEMRLGGLFDQIGFGFHRYSTDKKWFLPHFEKMLYDQAMLTISFTEAFQVTKNKLFEQTVNKTLTYVLRDMTSQNGGFYSAEDADSEGEEGKFYLWDKKEIASLLGKEDGEFLSEIFNVEKIGNYFEEATGHQTGTNHFYLSDIEENLAKKYGLTQSEFTSKLNSLRKTLFNERKKRIHPYKDDKILTDWNGLMIAALAKASRVLKRDEYSKVAEKAVGFIFTNLVDEGENLLHRFREGEAAIPAQIDDYSFLIWGLLELYETTFKIEYLQKSIELTDHLIKNYWDNENNSGFFFTSEDNSNLISRSKEFYDGAIPSGNSVMYTNLLKLNKLTANNVYLDYAENLGLAFKNFIDQAPTGFAQFLCGLQFSLGESSEIIVVGEKESEKTKEILDFLNSHFIPNKVVMLIEDENKSEIIKIAPFTEDYSTAEGETIVYVCKNYVCSLPTNDLEKLRTLLGL